MPSPVTIATGYNIDATKIEQQRKVFHNPRGLGYYYALIETADGTWTFYKSSNGSSWESTGVSISGIVNPSLWIYEDSGGSRLLIYIASVVSADSNVDVWCYKIDDAATNPASLWSAADVGTKTEDGTHNPVICLAGNGYLWVAWIDEYTSGGKQRYNVRVRCTTTTYPTIAPTWSGIVTWDLSAIYGNAVVAKVDCCPLTATANVGIVVAVCDLKGEVYLLKGKIGSYTGVGDPSLGTEVPFTNTSADMLHSIVAETGTDSDVFVLLKSGSPALICEKWDVSAATKSSFGTVYSANVDSLALNIDKTSTPDKLYAFYVKLDKSDSYEEWNLHRAVGGPYNVRVGQRVSYPETRYFTKLSFHLYKNLNPTGYGYVRIRKVLDDSILGTVQFDVSTLNPEPGAWEEFTFASPVEVPANTEFRYTVEYYGGDADNYILVAFDSIDPTHFGVFGAYTYEWEDDPTRDLAFRALEKDTGKLFYKTTGVDLASWSSETKIDDDAEALDYLSASYEDWNGDSKAQVVYTRQTSYAVRFTEVPVVPPPPPVVSGLNPAVQMAKIILGL